MLDICCEYETKNNCKLQRQFKVADVIAPQIRAFRDRQFSLECYSRRFNARIYLHTCNACITHM